MAAGHGDEEKPAFLLELTEQEIVLRKKWLQFKDSDEEILTSEVNKLLSGELDTLIQHMYAHFLSFDETKSFFPDEETLKRAQFGQKQYFDRLTKGDYGASYVKDRLRVGSTHHRIELDPKWYIGAYNHVLIWFMQKLFVYFGNDAQKLKEAISALMKLTFLDMGLAIESYIGAKEFYIKRHRDAIRELETENRVTKSILENAPIGIVSLSETFACREFNDQFMDIVGAGSRAEIVGKTLFEIVPHLPRLPFAAVIQSGQPHRRTADKLFLSKVATTDDTYWDWATWPVKDDAGKVAGLVAMFANVTDRVMLQQQREDFVATLTHDLKTPVSAANRAVQFLLDGDFGPIADQQKEILQTVLQSNKALYTLVQTLLDVYRFDSGVKELHMSSCNLAAIITQLVTEIMPLAQEKGVQLQAVLPADSREVICDGDEIRRVVQNLIDNSLKFTPTGGSIIVSMEQRGENTVVTVVDSGKGISEENRPKLFQRFWQAPSKGRYYASTGLGLYLCRRIVEAHHGKIWCESVVGQGSTFYFEI